MNRRDEILSKSFGKVECSERYHDFLNRIFSFQKSDFHFGVDRFWSSESVKSKVSDSGDFLNFFGDTIVFDLDDSQKNFINQYYLNPLYSVASNCLAERFDESTLHMTLHDLNASMNLDFELLTKMFDTELSVLQMIDCNLIKSHKIRMKTTCVFNMVNTSLVLGLIPCRQEDYYALMRLYCLIEKVHKLPYPFTPHITLAYYSRNGFEGEQLKCLENTINELNRETFELELSTDRLYYQKFISMNEFFSVMRLTGK